MKYLIGDIVWVSEAVVKEQAENVKNHLFVIIDDDGNVVPMDYYGFVLSSRLEKSKENSNFKYNEIIETDKDNHLKTKSIVKCDQLMNFPAQNIERKIGEVNVDDLNRFLNAFENYLNEN